MKLLANCPEGLEAVGITPQRHGRLRRDVGHHAEELRAGPKRLFRRLPEIFLHRPNDPLARADQHLPAGLVDTGFDDVIEREALARTDRLDPVLEIRDPRPLALRLRLRQFEQLGERNVGDPTGIEPEMELVAVHRPADRRRIGENFLRRRREMGEPLELE